MRFGQWERNKKMLQEDYVSETEIYHKHLLKMKSTTVGCMQSIEYDNK